MIQQQVLKEVYHTASGLGITDTKLIGHLLTMCANPTTILDRNLAVTQSEEGSLKKARSIPIEEMISSLKHTLYELFYGD